MCRKHGVSEATVYKWKAKYGGMEVSDARRLKALETENAKLKRVLAEAMLDNAMPRDGGKKMMTPAARREAAADLGQVHGGEPAAGMPGDRRGPRFGGLPPPATR